MCGMEPGEEAAELSQTLYVGRAREADADNKSVEFIPVHQPSLPVDKCSVEYILHQHLHDLFGKTGLNGTQVKSAVVILIPCK